MKEIQAKEFQSLYPNITVLEAVILGIDYAKKYVILQNHENPVEYDILSICLGAQPKVKKNN